MFVPALALSVVVLGGNGTGIHTWKLSGELAGGNLREGDCAITPDGTRAVFFGRYELAGPNPQLYSAPADGSGEPKPLLSVPPRFERDDDIPRVLSFELTRDSQRAVFAVDDDYNALYSAPVDGSVPAQLLVQGSTMATSFTLSPDGDRAVVQTLYNARLFGVRTDGSGFVQIATAPDPYTENFLSVAITPDDARVVYIVGAPDAGGESCEDLVPAALFSVPSDASEAPVRLSTFPLGHVLPRPGHDVIDVRVTDFQLVPDGTSAVYATRERDETLQEGCIATRLLVVPVNGRERPRVLFSGAFERPVVEPAGKRIVYLGDLDGDGGALDLLSQDLDGADPVRLNELLTAGGSIEAFELTPDGRHVVFGGDPDGLGQSRAFVVPTDGSAAARELVLPLAPGRDVRDFHVGAGGERVVVRADVEADELYGLSSFALDGSPAEAVLLTQGVCVTSFEVTPDGARVLFHIGEGEARELWIVPVDGSAAPQRISGVEGASSIHVDELGTRVVYRGEIVHASDMHVYAADLEPSSLPTRIDDPSYGPVMGYVADFELHPDGEHVLFTAGSRDFAFPEFHLAPLDGSEPQRLLDGLVPGGAEVQSYQIDPLSGRVLYRVRNNADHFYESTVDLLSAPLDGSAPPVQLNLPLAPGDEVEEVALAGDRVLFRIQRWYEIHDLFTVPVDGSEPARLLNEPVPAEGHHGAGAFRITPDGQRVVFDFMPSDQAVPGLFCAPIDGSAASIRLNGSTRTAGFQLTPDGTRVVFITGFSSPRELFVVPIDGSSAPRRLHAPAANGRDVRWEFVVSPDSSQVVYVADHVVNERFELYVVPLDGSAPPRSLIPAPPPGQFIGNVRIDPSGQRAVYTLSASGPGHFASVLLDGSAPPVDLVPPSTVANVGALQAKQIFSNGWVVYTNSVPSGARRLYAVPVDGHAPAHLLSLPYESDRAGADSTFVIDGDRVFFTAGHTFEGYQLWVAAVDGSSGPVQVSPPGLEPLRYLYGSDPFAVVPGGELVVHLGAMTDGSNGFGLPVVGSTELFASSVGSVSGLPPRHGPAPRTVTPREIVR